MIQTPIILAHNVLDGALLTGNETPGHELYRLCDGLRHTWWQAPSTAMQDIDVRVKNMILNSDFENDLRGWALFTSGGASGEFLRNETSPISGRADAVMNAVDADDGEAVFMVFQYEPFFFKGGRTYRMMFRAKAQTATKQIRFGFLDNTFVESENSYKSDFVYQAGSGHYFDFTPASDGWYRVYVRLMESGTIQLDEVVVGEARSVNTLIIDRGHTLSMASIGVFYRNHENGGWGVAKQVETWLSPAPVFIEFEPVKALSWRIRIAVWTACPEIPPASAQILYLGERWTLPRNFSGAFDPHRIERIEEKYESDCGINIRRLKYAKGVFRATLSNLGDADYENVSRFFEDTNNGIKPFFFIFRPLDCPTDVQLMRLTSSCNVPYEGGARRSWSLEAEEVTGGRTI